MVSRATNAPGKRYWPENSENGRIFGPKATISLRTAREHNLLLYTYWFAAIFANPMQ